MWSLCSDEYQIITLVSQNYEVQDEMLMCCLHSMISHIHKHTLIIKWNLHSWLWSKYSFFRVLVKVINLTYFSWKPASFLIANCHYVDITNRYEAKVSKRAVYCSTVESHGMMDLGSDLEKVVWWELLRNSEVHFCGQSVSVDSVESELSSTYAWRIVI